MHLRANRCLVCPRPRVGWVLGAPLPCTAGADITPQKAVPLSPPCGGVTRGSDPMSLGTAHGHTHSSWVYEVPTVARERPGR